MQKGTTTVKSAQEWIESWEGEEMKAGRPEV